MQNVIIKGRDNPVTFSFTFTGAFAADGLNNFTGITVEIGSESYDLTNHVSIVDDVTLSLDIGAITSLADGNYNPEIIGTSATYPNGFLLTGCKKKTLAGFVTVTTC